MFCAQCGKPVRDDAKFCVSCGAPIEREEIQEVVEEVIPVVPEYESQKPPVQEPEEAPKKVYGYTAAIVLGSISLFLIFFGFMYCLGDLAMYGNISADGALGGFVIIAIPAFVMSLISFLRANKARRSQGTTATKVVFIISAVVFALAVLLMIILFFSGIVGLANETYYYYPEYDYEYFHEDVYL